MKCPKCGSENIVSRGTRKYCLSCGHKWEEEARGEEKRGFIVHGREFWWTKEELKAELGVPEEDLEKVWAAGKRAKQQETEGFYDEVLGFCRYDKDSFYLTNDLYGGYRYKCEKGSGATDYVPTNQVLDLAEKLGVETVSLAGGAWEKVGRKGWGERVTVREAKELVKKLRGGEHQQETVVEEYVKKLREKPTDYLRYVIENFKNENIVKAAKKVLAEREMSGKEDPIVFLRGHPAMYAVWSVLDMDRTLTATTKNVLWQDFVAAWNRRELLTNEQAELLLKLRW